MYCSHSERLTTSIGHCLCDTIDRRVTSLRVSRKNARSKSEGDVYAKREREYDTCQVRQRGNSAQCCSVSKFESEGVHSSCCQLFEPIVAVVTVAVNVTVVVVCANLVVVSLSARVEDLYTGRPSKLPIGV